LGSLECPDTSVLKGKTKQKPPEVEEAREGKPHNRVKYAPPRPWGSPRPDRGYYHGPWCPMVVVARFYCSAAFWCPSVLRLGPRVFAFLGVLWASSCYHLLILMAHTSLACIHLEHFSQNLGLNHRNLQ